MSTSWQRHHVLSLADFTPAEYETVLQTAASFREVLSRGTRKVPALQGRTVANLFFEPSTRTRSSFELAAKRLSADTLNFASATSSLTKGETILDTAKTYLAMGADLFVIRHQQAGVPAAIARELDRLRSDASVLNGGDGQHAHPSQALLDLFTLYNFLAPKAPTQFLAGKKVAIVGDILHSRVARSNVYSLTAMGAQVRLVGPPTLVPRPFAMSFGKARPEIHWQLEPALAEADFVMLLRLQKERMRDRFLPSLREYHQCYGLNHKRLEGAAPGVKILHPGPTNRGVEISSELMDDPEFSLISQQVASGVAVRMALLYLLAGSSLAAIA